MKISLERTQHDRTTNIATRCPHCGHIGTFLTVGINDIYTSEYRNNGNHPVFFLGIRKCPNQKCYGHLFFIADNNKTVLLTSPTENYTI